MSILNPISPKHLIDLTYRYQKCLSWVHDRPRFSIWFSAGFMGRNKRYLCRKILNPLIPATKRILIYELQTGHKKIRKLLPYTKKSHGRHILSMAGKSWEFFLPLLYKPRALSTIHDIRGSILIQCSPKEVPWQDIFQHVFGPMVINNPSTGCGRVALNLAKRCSDQDNIFVIVEKINSGLESITITGQNPLVTDLFHLAATTCHLTVIMANEFEFIDKAEQSVESKSI